VLSLAKISSACIFIFFSWRDSGESKRLLTVKISKFLLNLSVGCSFGEQQLHKIAGKFITVVEFVTVKAPKNHKDQ